MKNAEHWIGYIDIWTYTYILELRVKKGPIETVVLSLPIYNQMLNKNKTKKPISYLTHQ